MFFRKMGWVFAAGGMLLSGCVGTTTIFQPVAPVAADEAQLFRIILLMSAVVFVGVEAALIGFSIRYRRRRQDAGGEPRQIQGNLFAEVTWTVVPVLLVITILVLTLSTMRAVAVPSAQSSDYTVNVIGHRWWWEFQYPSLGIDSPDELHIPVNKTVLANLTSADVIHSFWPPQLTGKTDVIPGQTNHAWLRAEQIGVYSGQCAEFCGTQHANMRFKVIVQSQADFDAWAADMKKAAAPAQGTLEQRGEQLVTTGICAGCHTIDGTKAKGVVGPNLTHLYSRTIFAGGIAEVNDQNIANWIQHSDQMKPGNLMQNVHVQDQDVQAIVAYLRTLK